MHGKTAGEPAQCHPQSVKLNVLGSREWARPPALDTRTKGASSKDKREMGLGAPGGPRMSEA
eukprot:9742852-Lingulodinium_polyedra.AAC.1